MNITKQIKVIQTLDDNDKVVLNVGSTDGITDNQRFLIYSLGSEFFDPDTNENLGRLEIVKGTGVVIHLQPKICTVKSDRIDKSINTKVITQESSWTTLSFPGQKITESIPVETQLPFDNPEVGDFAKIIESYPTK